MVVGAVFLAPGLGVAVDDADVEGTRTHPLEPPDTSSPRATFQSFLTDANAGWRAYLGSAEERREGKGEPSRHVRRAARTLDLSETPPAQREEVSLQTVILLLDVLNRVPFPAIQHIPNAEQMEADGLTRWTLPHTRIAIERMEEGPREEEWLFTAETIEGAREFYRRTRQLPLKPGAVVEDGFEIFIALPGWMIPVAWIDALPEWVQEVYFEQTVWQWVLVGLLLLLVTTLAVLSVRWSRRAPAGTRPNARRALVGPASLMLLSFVSSYLIKAQFGVTGAPHLVLLNGFSGLFFLAAAWTVVTLGSIVAETIISSPHVRPGSVDGQLVRAWACAS
jgi:MscS family membrane protein